jgi:hypothetical protein
LKLTHGTKAKQQGSSSFLKKRTKKLLFVARCREVKRAVPMLGATDNSFLVLFFKKELRPSLPTGQSF